MDDKGGRGERGGEGLAAAAVLPSASTPAAAAHCAGQPAPTLLPSHLTCCCPFFAGRELLCCAPLPSSAVFPHAPQFLVGSLTTLLAWGTGLLKVPRVTLTTVRGVSGTKYDESRGALGSMWREAPAHRQALAQTAALHPLDLRSAAVPFSPLLPRLQYYPTAFSPLSAASSVPRNPCLLVTTRLPCLPAGQEHPAAGLRAHAGQPADQHVAGRSGSVLHAHHQGTVR